jgi:putative ABC transport system permease protein
MCAVRSWNLGRGASLNRFRLVRSNLRYHWRTNAALLLGVAVGTAVLTGALLVGDSVRGSLRDLVLDRLGRIDEVLVTNHFFRAELADEIAKQQGFSEDFTAAVPAIVAQGTLEHATPDGSTRAGGVTIIGCTPAFWDLDTKANGSTLRPIERREVILNRPLADELGVDVGEQVLVRLGRRSDIPADSPLGRKDDAAHSVRLRVVDVIAAKGLGRFGLRPSQQLPHVAYIDLKTIQQTLDQPDRVNAIFVSGKDTQDVPTNREHQRLQTMLQPTLDDYGLELEQTKLGYFNLTSRQMLLNNEIVEKVEKVFRAHEVQPAFTYLANTIASGTRSIPYSTITAIDCNAALGPVLNVGECLQLANDEIVLNRWAAEDLQAEIGDEISVTYFDPETTHGNVKERTAKFQLKAITNLSGQAADPKLTPELVGITDRLSLGDWDPPFPYDSKRIRQQDEDYWDDYRTTPKAFISLATGRRLWGSRFGDTTSLRFVASQDMTRDAIIERLDLRPTDLAFSFRPIREQSLAAASGTTPFDLLFLGFSFFLIAAALMLVALLFRLSVEQRATEIGTLLAVGIGRKATHQIMLAEGLIIATGGALLGTLFGMGYAWLMLAGLRTWWLAAIGTPFLFLHVTWQSLTAGELLGFASAGLTIWWVVRRMNQLPLARLLAGNVQTDAWQPNRAKPWRRAVALTLFVLAILLGIFALQLGGEAQAGAFFGSGAMVLAAALLELAQRLRRRAMGNTSGHVPSLFRLALASTARNPNRSVLTVGLVASATFLIAAISAFRLDPTDAGAGGFSLIAQSDRPVFANLDTTQGIRSFAFAESDEQSIANTRIASLRVKAGDDASCLNLYRPRQPRILGVPMATIEMFGSSDRTSFAWAATAAKTDADRANPWQLMLPEHTKADAIPVVLDMNTAMYSLHLWQGIGSTFTIENDNGDPILLRVVGLLKNSIFQGDILMAEDTFKREFPDVSGYRLFLIDTRARPGDAIADSLESTLGDFGFDVASTHQRLSSLLAVQNTYLSTFQSLGGLGLLLGTIGLAIVQLRSVLQRRSEFAVMRATGFRRTTLAKFVLLENVLILFGGLAIGLVAAMVAVLPHLLAGGARMPWLSLGATLFVVALVGFAASSLAVRSTLRAPLLPALRGD